MDKLIQFPHTATPSASDTEPSCPLPERRELLPVAIVLWVASVARVAMTVLHYDLFGAEATLALACVFLIPALALRAARDGTDKPDIGSRPIPVERTGRLVELAERRGSRKAD
jgi:hypothetical protein